MHRLGQLDPVVIFGSHKGITWRRYGAAEALVGRQEPDYRGKFPGILGDERRQESPRAGSAAVDDDAPRQRHGVLPGDPVGCRCQNVPSPATLRNLPDEEKAEALLRERPLLYVASSRARDALVVTWSGTRTDL